MYLMPRIDSIITWHHYPQQRAADGVRPRQREHGRMKSLNDFSTLIFMCAYPITSWWVSGKNISVISSLCDRNVTPFGQLTHQAKLFVPSTSAIFVALMRIYSTSITRFRPCSNPRGRFCLQSTMPYVYPAFIVVIPLCWLPFCLRVLQWIINWSVARMFLVVNR